MALSLFDDLNVAAEEGGNLHIIWAASNELGKVMMIALRITKMFKPEEKNKNIQSFVMELRQKN